MSKIHMHTHTHMQVCEHFYSLQRPGRKRSTKKGRPPVNGKKVLSNYIHTITTITERPLVYELSSCPVTKEKLQCPACDNILHKPLQLGCGALICANCVHSWIQNFPCDQVACPCCYDSLRTASIRPAPPAIEELLVNLLVSCTQCNKRVKAGDLHNHLLSGCNLHTLDEQPDTEMHVAGSILRRHLQGENIITVPPGKQGGKVQCYTCTCLYTCMYMYMHTYSPSQ